MHRLHQSDKKFFSAISIIFLTVSFLLLERLSAIMTECPASSNATQVWEPIYPAPPVTSIFRIKPPFLINPGKNSLMVN